jgi:hypothetical protein
MPGMPERVGKGPILRDLDKRYNTTDIDLQEARLNALKATTKDVADYGHEDVTGDGNLTEGDKDHLKEHWFTPKKPGNKGWWAAKHVDRILKEGLIAALETAIYIDLKTKQKRKEALPIETLWICSGDRDTGPFEIFISWNERQVTFIIHSPDILSYQDSSTAVIEDIWVVKSIDPDKPVGDIDGPKDNPKDDDLSPDLPDPDRPGKKHRIIKRRPKMNPKHS